MSQKAIESLITRVRAKDVDAQDIMAEALEKFDADIIEYVLPSLHDEDLAVRQFAIYWLGQLQDTRAIESLIPYLQDQNVHLRISVARALGEIGDARAVEPLIFLLSDYTWGNYRNVNHYVQEALQKIGTPKALQALETDWESPSLATLVNNLQSDLNFIRASNVLQLGMMGHRDARVIEPLIAQLQDEDELVRRCVVDVLWRIDDPRIVMPLIAQLQDEKFSVQEDVMLALQKMKIDDPQAIQALIAYLDIEEVNTVRQCAVMILGKLGNHLAVEPLIRLLQDENKWIRKSAVEALGNLGDVWAVKPLIVHLEDENAEVRQVVASALGKLGDVRAVNPLISRLHDEDYTWARRNIARALGEIGDTRAVEPLIACLGDKEIGVRVSVASALGKLGDTRAVEPLIPLLQDENNNIRKSVAETLGKLGDVRAENSLIPLLNEQSRPHSYTRKKINETAREALQKIGTPEALQAIKDAEEKGWFDD